MIYVVSIENAFVFNGKCEINNEINLKYNRAVINNFITNTLFQTFLYLNKLNYFHKYIRF